MLDIMVAGIGISMSNCAFRLICFTMFLNFKVRSLFQKILIRDGPRSISASGAHTHIHCVSGVNINGPLNMIIQTSVWENLCAYASRPYGYNHCSTVQSSMLIEPFRRFFCLCNLFGCTPLLAISVLSLLHFLRMFSCTSLPVSSLHMHVCLFARHTVSSRPFESDRCVLSLSLGSTAR